MKTFESFFFKQVDISLLLPKTAYTHSHLAKHTHGSTHTDNKGPSSPNIRQ